MMNIKSVVLMPFVVLVATNSYGENYEESVINHRLILKGAESSGIEFKGADTAVMYAEMTGDIPVVEARVKWIGNNFFTWLKMGEIVMNALHAAGYIKLNP